MSPQFGREVGGEKTKRVRLLSLEKKNGEIRSLASEGRKPATTLRSEGKKKERCVLIHARLSKGGGKHESHIIV